MTKAKAKDCGFDGRPHEMERVADAFRCYCGASGDRVAAIAHAVKNQPQIRD